MDYRVNKAMENVLFGRDLYILNDIPKMIPETGRYVRIKRAKAIIKLLISADKIHLLYEPQFYRTLGVVGRDIYVVVNSGFFGTLRETKRHNRFKMPSTYKCLGNFTKADKRYRKFIKEKASLKIIINGEAIPMENYRETS